MPVLIDEGPKSSLSSADRDMYMLTLGIPFLQLFQLQVRRLVFAGSLHFKIVARKNTSYFLL